MADRKFYSIGFNLIDNFTAKYDGLTSKISKITDSTHLIKFEVDTSVVSKTEEMGRKVGSSTEGISKSIAKVTEGNKEMSESIKKTTDSSAVQVSAVDKLSAGYEGLAATFSRVRGVATGLFAILGAGAIGGMSWVSSYKTSMFKEQAFDILGERNKRLNLDELQEFANRASGTGYTSGSTRTSIAYTLGTRGGRNAGQIIAGTEGLERTFLKYDELLEREHGVTSSTDLADVATRKVVGRYDKEWLDAIFGKGFSSKSQSSRIKALGKVNLDVDIEQEKFQDPLDEIQWRVKSISSQISKSLETMFLPLSRGLARFLRLLDGNPVVPKIAAMAIAVTALGGGFIAATKGVAMLKAGVATLGLTANIAKFGALLLNPVGILIALGALLLIVAYKTGALSAAWDKFSKSAIGKDVLSGIQGIADVIGLVADKFGEWYEASGRSQLLSYFMSLVTILGHAYDFMDKIYSKTKGATGNPLLAGMVALASMPVALYAGGLKANTGIDATEILSGISDRIGSLSRWLTSNIPLGIEKITGFLSKLFSVINWIVNPFIRIFDIIKSLFEKVTSFLEEKFGVSVDGGKLDEAKITEDLEWAKNQRYDTGKRKFDVSDDTLRAARIEAETGESQPHAPMYKESDYDRIVNSFKNRLANPSPGGGDVAPEEGAAGNPFYNPRFTNKIDLPLGLELRTKPIDEIRGPWDVESPFQAVGRTAWDWLFGDKIEEAASGGDIKSDGLVKLHKNETVVPADIARSSSLNNLLRDVSVQRAEPTIKVYNSPRIDLSGMKIASDIDVEKLLKRIESMVESGSTKAVKDALGQRRT